MKKEEKEFVLTSCKKIADKEPFEILIRCLTFKLRSLKNNFKMFELCVQDMFRGCNGIQTMTRINA